jgi:DNA mismatch repair ATPase MutS
MILDETSLRNLEVFRTLRDGQRKGSLLWAVDARARRWGRGCCATGSGRRCASSGRSASGTTRSRR